MISMIAFISENSMFTLWFIGVGIAVIISLAGVLYRRSKINPQRKKELANENKYDKPIKCVWSEM